MLSFMEIFHLNGLVELLLDVLCFKILSVLWSHSGLFIGLHTCVCILIYTKQIGHAHKHIIQGQVFNACIFKKVASFYLEGISHACLMLLAFLFFLE